MAKKSKRPPVPDEQLEQLRDACRNRIPLPDGPHAGAAVMYLDATFVDRLVSELIRRRKND